MQTREVLLQSDLRCVVVPKESPSPILPVSDFIDFAEIKTVKLILERVSPGLRKAEHNGVTYLSYISRDRITREPLDMSDYS